MESKYTNKYEVACAILEKLEQGGSGSGKFTLDNSFKLGYSTFTEIPENLDFSEVTDFKYMFYHCNLTTVPSSLDTSNGTTFGGMFVYCSNLTSVGNLDTSNGTTFNNMFGGCSKLTSIPSLDTSNGTDFMSMFSGCNNLKTIQQLDISKSYTFNYMFSGCGSLENITLVGLIKSSIDFSSSSKLTYDSIKSILSAASRTTNTDAKTLRFNRTIADNNGELAALVGECTTKGWTITGLTLE